MFRLSDFFYLPQVEPLVKQFTTLDPGLLVIAGLDPRAVDSAGGPTFLPSGRSAIFRVLFDEMMAAYPGVSSIVICKNKFSVPRKIQNRIDFWKLRAEDNYASLIGAAVHRRPGLLVVDELNEENSLAALDAARRGCWFCHSSILFSTARELPATC
jgi:hypothetical protein